MYTIDAAQLATDIDTLATIVEPGTRGTTRRAFTAAYRASRSWVRTCMHEAGLEVDMDAAGNLVGRYPGLRPDAPVIMLGSHTDTVMEGGRFDGAIGVLGAIAVVRALRAHAITLQHTIEVVDFLAEESTPLGSLIGSTAMAQGFTTEYLARHVPGWGDLASCIVAMGGQPPLLTRPLRTTGMIGAYLELHIEQGPVLEAANVPVGVVTGIVGIRRCDVICHGRPDHAGTAGMQHRHDALAVAAAVILAAEHAAQQRPGTVATVGSLTVAPNQTNVVPGSVRFSLEMRSVHWPEVLAIWDECMQALTDAATHRGVTCEVTPYEDSPPLSFAPWYTAIVADAVAPWTPDVVYVPSGAGHDGSMIGVIAPVAMIFVRTKDGRSHCTEEFAAHADIVAGVNAMLHTVCALDAVLA